MPWFAIASSMLSMHRQMLGLPDPEPSPPDPVLDAMQMAATANMQTAMLCPDDKIAAEAMKAALEMQWKMIEHNVRKSFESLNLDGLAAYKLGERDGSMVAESVDLRDPGGTGDRRQDE
jgi:hypothetical protein